MMHLAVSHDVIKDSNGENSASSPDELAFVAIAKACGYEFVGRDKVNNIISIKNNNTIYDINIL